MEDLCSKCGKHPKQPLHPCPYLLDVWNECYLPEDEQTLCECCEECEGDCADNI